MEWNQKKILVVDDEKHVQRLLLEILKKEGYKVQTVGDGKQAIEKMEQTIFDLVLMDIRMPVMNGIEAFKILSGKYPDIPFIMMTAFASVDTAIETMKLGAFNYISKPFNNAEVRLNVKRALAIRNMTDELQELRQKVQSHFSINSIIGKSAKMQEMYKMIGKVASTNAIVLIQGESGTGKELVAKAIHYNSDRKERPLVDVNCAALPSGLLESELFGHEKGSFTGAASQKKGKFEYAHEGTIFLDEICEMELNLQAKLLRVIQEKEFQRVGGLETYKTDVRIIAATNRKMDELVKSGEFREDLYYRLNVVQVSIPPLRERKDDLPLLVDYFLNKFNKKTGKSFQCFSTEAMKLINAYNWTGNVRELENAVERAVVMGSGKIIMPEDLPMNLQTGSENSKASISFENRPLKEILREVERKVIGKTLEETGWNKMQTAKKLQMSRKAVLYKIEKYNLRPKES